MFACACAGPEEETASAEQCPVQAEAECRQALEHGPELGHGSKKGAISGSNGGKAGGVMGAQGIGAGIAAALDRAFEVQGVEDMQQVEGQVADVAVEQHVREEPPHLTSLERRRVEDRVFLKGHAWAVLQHEAAASRATDEQQGRARCDCSLQILEDPHHGWHENPALSSVATQASSTGIAAAAIAAVDARRALVAPDVGRRKRPSVHRGSAQPSRCTEANHH
mmetsp:Transcript_85037/g.189899  ORF Transcript_85037/g.189899 Transcript_85037/m.189899 type:complete len:223 (+) Transcript_85037:86-754(+)